MSALLARIMLAMLMLPAAAVFYTIVFVTQKDTIWLRNLVGYSDRAAGLFVMAGAATWVFVALYWWLLWRKLVRWSAARLIATSLAAGAAIAVGLLFYFSLRATMRYDSGFSAWAGSVVAPLSWLLAATCIWRETAAERSERTTGNARALACPTCGYNLTGLKGTRCPECGSSFTLDELLQAQADRGEAL